MSEKRVSRQWDLLSKPSESANLTEKSLKEGLRQLGADMTIGDTPVCLDEIEADSVWFRITEGKAFAIHVEDLEKLLSRVEANVCILCGRKSCWPALHDGRPAYPQPLTAKWCKQSQRFKPVPRPVGDSDG